MGEPAWITRTELRRIDAATGWITGLPSNLEPDDAGRLHAIRHRCPELDAVVRHVAGFARMIKDLSGDQNTLTKWIGAVDADLPAILSCLMRLTVPSTAPEL